MLRKLRQHLSYANVVSTLCLFVLLGGTAYAAVALERGSVKGKHIAKNAVTTKKVKNRSLRAGDLRAGVLPPAGSGIGKIRVKTIVVTLPSDGDDVRAGIGCAVDERIIGGAVTGFNSSAEVLSSRPARDEAGTLAEDGEEFTHWMGLARATGGVQNAMRLTAICAEIR